MKLYHRQVCSYAYHRPKLDFVRAGSLDDNRAGDTHFAPLADFLESIPTMCPHDLFRREDDPKARASQAHPAFADISRVIVNSKRNAATETAGLIIPGVGNNKLRNKTLQRFMLANDSVTVAIEMIDETYAVFYAWDFSRTKRQNLDRLRDTNFIEARTSTWLRAVAKVLNRRFDPDRRDRALVGRGKHWIVVTSQEKLNEIVSGLDDKKIELARLMDRFPLQVHLEPSDISEVTSRWVLRKAGEAETVLGRLFDQSRARLEASTRLTADISLPPVTRQSFIDLYPMLPYQIVLIIDIVSGLRTHGGASKHVSGANRTIIKLAQQLLINPATKLADHETGVLVRLDHVYDLIDSNIASAIHAKIASMPKSVAHPLAKPVAKVVCLLQFVPTVHRTAENIAPHTSSG
jgi:hypothetical protein